MASRMNLTWESLTHAETCDAGAIGLCYGFAWFSLLLMTTNKSEGRLALCRLKVNCLIQNASKRKEAVRGLKGEHE
jgi:hypothetical protein